MPSVHVLYSIVIDRSTPELRISMSDQSLLTMVIPAGDLTCVLDAKAIDLDRGYVHVRRHQHI
jgi:hypothetical protein